MAEAEQEAWREEVFSLITLATDSFPETGRARRGKRCNKERMNGRMKEREGELLGTGWCQSIISSVLLDEGSNEGMETQKAAAALPSGSKAQVPRAGTAIQASKAQTEHTPPTHTHTRVLQALTAAGDGELSLHPRPGLRPHSRLLFLHYGSGSFQQAQSCTNPPQEQAARM